MFGTSNTSQRILDALERSYAVIEFKPDGTILRANENFLAAMGYQASEVVGRHHRMFVEPELASSQAYADFWAELRTGQFKSEEFRRVAKGGREIWIEATYNPVCAPNGQVERVVKLATDVTERRHTRFDYESQISAISTSQAVIEFDLTGHILKANQNFCDAMGYSEAEIVGQHHRMLCDAAYAASQEYKDFWAGLARGEFQAGEFHRYAKGGREIWLQATYNPVRDLSGNPIKVVKLATDATSYVQARLQRESVQSDITAGLGEVAEGVAMSTRQARDAAESSSRASENVQAVAAGAEELSSSFQEVSRRVTEALSASRQAVSEAERTSTVMSGLSDAAQEIGQVVELINSIAEQTNLLALNATIEAARAGEAGKGFAVVASEVKNLAGQTAQAIDNITAQIASVQSNTEGAVEAIAGISSVISQIDDIAAGIASAVEEQTAVTQNISANMHTASEDVNAVSSAVSEIAQSSARVDESARNVSAAAASMG